MRARADLPCLLACSARVSSKDDCSRQRFIAWAAVRRNACPHMSDSERRECPLHMCRRRFADHESMLKHLAGCDLLPSCEYWCFDHARVERFDDSKCQKCLLHPSKRRRMLHMAKSFFSSLGHKSKKGHPHALDFADDAPPSYSEITPQMLIELSATEIVELDGVELPEPMPPAPAASIDPQELFLPELDSTAVSIDALMEMQWQPSPLVSDASLASPADQTVPAPGPAPRPSLQVNTQGLDQFRRPAAAPHPRPAPPPALRSKHLSPSSSVRSNASTASNTSNGSSIISPISSWSHGSHTWSSGIETNLTSPDEDICMTEENTFITIPAGWECPCPPGFPHGIFSELPANEPPANVAPVDLSSDTLLFPLDPPVYTTAQYAASVIVVDDVLGEEFPAGVVDADLVGADLVGEGLDSDLDLASVEIEDLVCYSETKSMVATSWDMLKAHITSSLEKTQSLSNNPLAEQLRSLSPQVHRHRRLLRPERCFRRVQPRISRRRSLPRPSRLFAVASHIRRGGRCQMQQDLHQVAGLRTPLRRARGIRRSCHGHLATQRLVSRGIRPNAISFRGRLGKIIEP